MAEGHDVLEYELNLALELARELRIEGSREALADAVELEVACCYWQGVLPTVLDLLRNAGRRLAVLPLSGLAISRVMDRALRAVNAACSSANAACCNVANTVQNACSPLVSTITATVTATVTTSIASAAVVAASFTPYASAQVPIGLSAHSFAALVELASSHGTLSPSARQKSGNFAPAISAGYQPLAIDQTSPTDPTVTTTASATFADQLVVTGDIGAVTYSEVSGQPALAVSPTGAITTSGTLVAGTYTATGSDTDAFGDSGTWTYTVTVTPVAIDQTSPTDPTVTTTASATFADQLVVTGDIGAVTYSEVSGQPALAVSPTGAITTSGTLVAGTYTATGSDTDAFGDSGTWTYTVTVTPVAIDQTSPTDPTVTTTASATFADQLVVTGDIGAVTYSEVSGQPALAVSPTGAITTSGTLVAGTYTATGSDTDAFGDSGTWTYTVTVTPVAIDQTSPTDPTVTTTASATFADQLVVTGDIGAVTYSEVSGQPALAVSPTGAITTSGTLVAGTYTATGSDTDAFGDSGTWTYTVTVTPVAIDQTSPTDPTVTTTASATFADQLVVTGDIGAVTYSEVSGQPALAVSPTGAITTSGTLVAGTYTATGSDTDAFGDSGTWTYTVTVTPVAIDQTSPTDPTVTTTASATFADQLVVTGDIGAVTYSEVSGQPALAVSPTGAITTSGTLVAGTYTATGSDTDAFGDSGTWTYTVTVTPVAIDAVDCPPVTPTTT